MKFSPFDPARVFRTGRDGTVEIRDVGRLALEPDEQVTLVTGSGTELDVARKSWGYYATPSLNGRLVERGLRAVLVRNAADRYYVLLVERGLEAELHRYLAREDCAIVRWLDGTEDLAALGAAAPGSHRPSGQTPSCMCRANAFTTVRVYEEPPEGETPFTSGGAAYRRRLRRCTVCGHFVSSPDGGHGLAGIAAEDFYRQSYVTATYGDGAQLRHEFDRIVALPAAGSDNAGRVGRVTAFAERRFGQPVAGRRVLDVGSGLCVFLHAMKQRGWLGTALDPDERAVTHAREMVGVRAVRGEFPPDPTAAGEELDGRFDLVTFNKVLEHVVDPVPMLSAAARCLAPGGFVYLEVPDAEAALVDERAGRFGREEFFIEHWHVFSATSMSCLATHAGFRLETLERLREPSGKYTLRAFLVST